MQDFRFCYVGSVFSQKGECMANKRNYKSNVFAMLLEEKERALELYNAVNDSNYDDPGLVEINTIEVYE